MNNKVVEDYLNKLNKGDIKGCLYYIRKKEYIVLQLADQLGFTILHKLANLNLFEESLSILDIIINDLTKFEFISFINQKNKSGFTALHYACYNGNIKLIKLLINYGADINAVNNNGLNVLHLSAQGNQSTPLYYFIHKYKMNINTTDKLGNTSLHWACFYNNDKALNYLLLCDKININIRNKNGFTPLHFSVLGRNIKAIKKLIMSGADISIKNNNNETCLYLAIKKNYKDIKDALTQNIFLIKNNSLIIFFFYLLHIIITLLNLFFIMKQFFNSFYIFLYCIWSSFLYGIIYYFNKITNISYMNLIQKNKNENLFKLIEKHNIDINNYCSKCNIFINNGSFIKHCYICDICIEDFDHHCFWIGKCVGKNNKKIFLLLLVLIEFNFIINTIICIVIEPLFSHKYQILCHKLNIEKYIHFLFLIYLIAFLFGSIIIIPLIRTYFKKFNKENALFSFNEKENEKNSKKSMNLLHKYNESLLNDK